MIKILTAVVFAILLVGFGNAATINIIENPKISPGGEGIISLEIENTLSDKITSVSMTFNFENLPFIPVGSSEESIDEIDEGDEEKFNFRIKAANDISPGDYAMPYTLSYNFEGDEKTKQGSLGIRVTANPDLSFSLTSVNPVVNQKGEISVRIINKGFFDARFLSVRVIPNGMTLLSEEEVYIGNVDSDDFETANFEVLFTSSQASLNVITEYKDFDNQLVRKSVNLPVTAYTEERAIDLGIIEKSMVSTYLLIVLALVLIVLLIRFLRKRSRIKKSSMRG